MADATSIIQTIGLALGSAGGGFTGAFFNFKARLKTAEDAIVAVKASLDVEFPKLTSSVGALMSKFENLQAAWTLEFTNFRNTIETRIKHAEEIELAEERGRASRPDPLEDLWHRLEQAEKEFKKLRTRNESYVRESRFAAYAKDQEAAWRQVNSALGELRGAVETLMETLPK